MNISQMKYYKQQKGYSFAKLSELSGVPQGTIQKIFSGETRSPRYDTLRALEEVLCPQEGSEGVQECALEYAAGRGGYTLEDYYALPQERRAELIDGIFYDMASPSARHQIFSTQLALVIGMYLRGKNGSCILFQAPMDVQLDEDDRTMVQPDVFVLCDRKKLTSRCVVGAPDFIIEILSSSTRRKDAILKLMKYREAGVREYWLVDTEKERVIVYFFDEDELPRIYGAADDIPVGIYGGELTVPVGEIFEQARGIGE